MKPRGVGGVVDERLNVYGTQGLKVAGKIKDTGSSEVFTEYFYH